jgi:predicted nuclease of predicted toxin-antitoxin system
MPRFLVDESLPRAVTRALHAAGHEVVDARDVGLRGHPDAEIAVRAASETRIVVSADLDFGNALAFPPGTHPGVLVTRLPATWAPEQVAARVLTAVAEVGPALEGAITIIEPLRVRIFGRPLEPETVTLFRPVGRNELDLIEASGNRAFPPRLPEQPIFYPVLDEDYAVQIARDWNTKHSKTGLGYVTRFRVRRNFLVKYSIQTVGSSSHREYWIPADELTEFNANIVGAIEVIAEFTARKSDE